MIATSEGGRIFLRPSERQYVFVEFRSQDNNDAGSYQYSAIVDRAGHDTSTGPSVLVDEYEAPLNTRPMLSFIEFTWKEVSAISST